MVLNCLLLCIVLYLHSYKERPEKIIFVCLQLSIYVRMHVSVCVCVRVCVYACLCVCVRVCNCVCKCKILLHVHIYLFGGYFKGKFTVNWRVIFNYKHHYAIENTDTEGEQLIISNHNGVIIS